MRRFEGRVALVTGAGSGIGRATAARFAREGAHVACIDIVRDGVDETVRGIADGGGEAAAFVCDIADEAQVRATVKAALDRFGRLHHVANVAGILRTGSTHECGMEVFDRVIGVNLRGTFLVCRESIPHLLETRGTIVNTASTAALGAHPWMAAYAASKGGVIALTRSLSVEYIRAGLRVNVVIPGAIQTAIHASFRLPEGADMDLMRAATPNIAFGEPEDVAAAIAYLSSEEARYIHGTELRVTGGALG